MGYDGGAMGCPASSYEGIRPVMLASGIFNHLR